MSREKKVSAEELSILNLPSELVEYISGSMDNYSLSSFSQACGFFRDHTSLNRLMRAVVYGAESSVIALLNTDNRKKLIRQIYS